MGDVGFHRPGGRQIALGAAVSAVAGELSRAAVRRVAAQVAKQLKRTMSQKGRKSKRSKKAVPRGIVFPQADAVGKFRVSSGKRSKRPKKTLSDKVRSLQKQVGSLPKDTSVHYTNTIPYIIGNTAPNQGEIIQIAAITHATYDNALTSVNGFDYTAATGNQVRIKSCFSVMEFQNFGNTAITIKYQWVKCVDSGSEGPLDNIVEEAANRGKPYTGFADTFTAASDLSAAIPTRQFVEHDEGEQNNQVFGVQTNKWKPVSTVKKVRMGPSDLLKITHAKKGFLWKNEWFVNDPATYMPGDIFLLATFQGDYQKNSVTNTGLISKSPFVIVCSRFVSCKASVADKQGLIIHNYKSAFDSAEVELPLAITEDDPARKVPLVQ